MVGPISGFTVAVTALRRADDFATLLERRGAKVVLAPAVRIVPVVDDAELSLATKQCLIDPPDVLVATTGIGFRGWIEAASEWGLADDLIEMLSGVRIFTRGPKALGAVRAAGLSEEWSPESESSSEILELLEREDLRGKRIAVQLHGHQLPDFVDSLRERGATVVELAPYRWLPPVDIGPIRRLLELIVARQVDAVTFTSAPAALTLLQVADEMALRTSVINAFQDHVLAVCVGPVTADVLQRVGIPTTQPARARLGALAREVVEQLKGRNESVGYEGGRIEIRGHAVLLDDGELRPLTPASMALLRALSETPGVICSRGKLGAVLPGGTDNDDHAIEVAVGRLRSALGDPSIIQTVVRRGYRLNT